MLRILLVICLLLTNTSLWAKSKGLIWEIESANYPTYLMGSVHFGKPDLYPLSDEIMAAYRRSEIVYVEVDIQQIPFEEQQRLTLKYALYPPGEKLQDHISSETLKAFSSILGNLGADISRFQQLRPNFLMINIALMQGMSLGYQQQLGVDQFFLNEARNKKTIREIESFESQMELLTLVPDDDKTLQDSLRDMDEFEALWKLMMNAWKNGDGEALYKEAIARPLEQYPHLEPFFQKMFFDRNVKMADAAEECANKKERCFIIVGAGHLVGPGGMVDLLQQRGFKLQQK